VKKHCETRHISRAHYVVAHEVKIEASRKELWIFIDKPMAFEQMQEIFKRSSMFATSSEEGS